MTNELDSILISSSQPNFKDAFLNIRFKLITAAFFESGTEEDKKIDEIFLKIGRYGDKAVAELTRELDSVTLSPEDFRIKQEDLSRAHNEIDGNLLLSLRQSIKNVRKYQSEIFIANKKDNQHPGIRYTPIKRVGICVPGASAPLPSTVIMCAVPAQVAGVEEIVVVSPPKYNGSIHPVILATCCELGIREVYRIGGAQAVGALACGTEVIGKVDKIVGPGNRWVQMAKQKQFGFVDIDSIAGPSEVLILANEQANPIWIAADMLSQAEHAPGSAFLFTDSRILGEKTLEEIKRQVMQLDRSQETVECLKKFSGIVIFNTIDDAVVFANEFASEHLQIQCGEKSKKIASKIRNAGAMFIGDYTPVAVGDYWAGPSHSLPTGMTAKFFSPLSANDFIKSTSIIEYDRKKLLESAEDIIRLAKAEGLDAHARSVRIRMQ